MKPVEHAVKVGLQFEAFMDLRDELPFMEYNRVISKLYAPVQNTMQQLVDASLSEYKE